MDTDVVATPPLVARPLRLEPFRALMLAPSRIGARVSARAFSRPYRDVAARLAAWERAGDVHHDTAPALYLHEYTTSGLTIRGLVGAMPLADHTDEAAASGEVAVYPHEGIHPAQAAELADRMAEMAINPAPILLTHHGSEDYREQLRATRAGAPDHQFTDRSGQYHRVWTITDTDIHSHIAGLLRDTTALIADGHHRYAAYDLLRSRHPDLGPATGAGLAMLVDQVDTPLYLGAIHRVLHGLRLSDLGVLGDRLRVDVGPQEAVAALGTDTVVATDGQAWATVALSPDGDRLAAELIQEQVLGAIRRAPTATVHVHSVDDALRAIARRRGLALLMPAPDFADVLRIARLGRLLPEKVTSFQPKPSVGVLIRSLRDG